MAMLDGMDHQTWIMQDRHHDDMKRGGGCEILIYRCMYIDIHDTYIAGLLLTPTLTDM
jgi:hypothetical protein